ncbi:MAG: hypothetical protein HZC16_03760 [Candidatus Omnitrophica bacterium]|nr:hypothetical protein [Candidatus Omnitrophota bacterium]
MPPKKKEEYHPSSDFRIFLADTAAKENKIYLERQKNNTPGDDVSDWLKAEAIIKKKYDMK